MRGIIFGVILLLANFAFADPVIGKLAPSFEVLDINGKEIRLEELRGKYVVLEWFHPLCPFTGKHYKSNNMQQLQKKYAAKDVVWISIHTDTRGDSADKQIASIKGWVQETGSSANFFINDKSASIAKLYTAKVTPHMFVIAPDGKLIYAGAIDDKASAKINDVDTAKNYVAAALNEAFDGKPVSEPANRPYGCPVKY
ncbi:MAG: redoxin domain-containing protein [Cellvibrio sp.]|uniref:redoxin domain-containing protein n=1 Tax=Cellvibrio sp. TaxID=1965322 RepID=UPI00272606BC|nr:redoxin domain-containing protein [Cellvibrio sp.]